MLRYRNFCLQFFEGLCVCGAGEEGTCYPEEYAQKAQKNTDLIHAALDYVQGSNQMLEKLVGGRWDRQFLIEEPGHLIRHRDFFDV